MHVMLYNGPAKVETYDQYISDKKGIFTVLTTYDKEMYLHVAYLSLELKGKVDCIGMTKTSLKNVIRLLKEAYKSMEEL